jgi:hypothetical protein
MSSIIVQRICFSVEFRTGDLSSRFVVRRDWNFAEVKFGGHRSVMVRRGCHLGEKGGHAALSKVPVPSDNKSQGTCGHFIRLPHSASGSHLKRTCPSPFDTLSR